MGHYCIYRRTILASAVAAAAFSGSQAFAQQSQNRQSGNTGQATQLEEVIVTAQKREQSLQSAPIAISALTTGQLQNRGILGLQDLTSGAIPALKVKPFPNNPSSLVISIRGIGQADAAQATKEMATGIYLDGVYLGRSQGLGFDVADPARIEVLRGPQGALYGRNSIGGAINLVSKKPDDQFSLSQTFGYGKYGDYKSLSHINVPITDNFFAKLSYLYNKRDGWVKNPHSKGDNFAAADKRGGRAAFRWEPSDTFTVDYAYDWSRVQTTSLYYQFARVNDVVPGVPYTTQPVEPDREDTARYPLPLEPSDTQTFGHTLTLTWNVSPNNTLKYIGAYRSLDESTRGDYGGVFLVGQMPYQEDTQNQTSHELQLVGSAFDHEFDYVAGLYYYHENTKSDDENYSSVLPTDQLGTPFGTAFPWDLTPYMALGLPPAPLGDFRRVNGDSISKAVYTQLTWRPNMLDSKLALTLGMRYTKDKKKYERLYNAGAPLVPPQRPKIDDDNFSPTFTVAYDVTDTLNVYGKWANGYRAGGVNMRSASFREYDADKVESWELGLKSQWLENRLRANFAWFHEKWKDAQIDFSDLSNIAISDTINAEDGDPKITGVEADLTAILFTGLTATLNYQWMHWTYPDQANPLSGDVMERFVLPQAPKHSASLSLDYELPSFSFGTLGFHADANYTADYYYTPQNYDKGGSHTEINGRITLSQIPVGLDGGSLEVGLWGKNLTDREWKIDSIRSGFTLAKAYAMPRSYGINVTFRYH